MRPGGAVTRHSIYDRAEGSASPYSRKSTRKGRSASSGTYVLIGIAVVEHDETFVEQRQTTAPEDTVVLSDGSVRSLPFPSERILGSIP